MKFNTNVRNLNRMMKYKEEKIIREENKIQGQENSFGSNILMQIPVPIIVLKGRELVIEFANEAYLQTIERSREFVGKPLFEFLPELLTQGLKEKFDDIFVTGKPFIGNEMERNIPRNKRIERGYFNVVYQPVFDHEKNVSGIIVIINDVTEHVNTRKIIAASKNIYHDLIFSSASMMAMLKGEEMFIDIANDAILETWGKGREVFGKSLFSILPELLDQGFDKILSDVYQTGIPFHAYEKPVYLIRNGISETVYFTFVYQAQRNAAGQIEGVSIIANEVTSQALANNKIKESEANFRLIAELMTEKVSNANSDGSFKYYNKSWITYTGASFEELIKQGWEKWIHKDELAETQKRWLYSIKTGQDFEMELRLLKHTGEFRWHISKAKAVKDEAGKIKLWLGFNTDIQDQKQKEEELELLIANRTQEILKVNKTLLSKNKEIEAAKEKLLSEYSRSLIEASLDPLIVISTKGKITDMNQATIDVTGTKREHLLGSDFFEYFTEPKNARKVYQKIFEKGFVVDAPLTIKDHKLTDVLFNGSVYKNENGIVIGAVMVARDITEQKLIEKELTEAKVFAELATAIAEEAKEKAESATLLAEEAVKTKQAFLSNMSHEIRTPMNAIIGFTKVVLRTELSAKQKEYLTAIKMSGDSLIVLINDILDLAKVDAGKMVFEQMPFKLALSISAMLNLFETKIQEKNLLIIKNYDKNIPDVLLGDAARLHQIILNLVSNAVKFTEKGEIVISARLLAEDEKKATIEFAVTDSGIGIAEDKIEKIFENFHQATSSISRLYGGTGLGLAIVKQLVENQGGYIKVKSKIEKGSTFSFVLDFQKTSAEALLDPEIVAMDSEIKDIKVLVVEDMALNQLLMKTLLDDFGFESDISANGKLAIEKLETKPYDIILMDLQMPEMNGFEATKYIRTKMKSDIPIIALTADVTTVDLEKCKAIGMNDYIAKPVDERLLYSKIVNLIKKPVIILATEPPSEKKMEHKKQKYVDLAYLLQRTKSNPDLMFEMISIYLEQTPTLIFAMKQSLKVNDWKVLQAVVHKMIPSFSIMGMSTDFVEMAKKLQEYAHKQQQSEGINDIALELETACAQACTELTEELIKYKRVK